MPFGGGAPFAGGTVSGAVTLAGGTAARDALIVTSTALASDYGEVVEVVNGDAATVFTLSTSGDAAHRMRRADATFDVIAHATQNRDVVRIINDGGTRIAGITLAGGLMTACHAAPADAELANGDAAIWLDQTPAATKLMVKAKDSAGTVRTAAVNLA